MISTRLSSVSIDPTDGQADIDAIDWQRLNILVVDDDYQIRPLVTQALADYGANVQAAHDGKHALQLLAHRRPACIVSDIGMHPVDGIELLHAVRTRADLGCTKIPVLLLTGHSEAPNVKAALRLDVDDFVLKPISLSNLVKRVARAIRLPKCAGHVGTYPTLTELRPHAGIAAVKAAIGAAQ